MKNFLSIKERSLPGSMVLWTPGYGSTRNPETAGLSPEYVRERISWSTVAVAMVFQGHWQLDGQIPKTSHRTPSPEVGIREVLRERCWEKLRWPPHGEERRLAASATGETRFCCQGHREHLSSQSTALQHEASPRKGSLCLLIRWTQVNQSYYLDTSNQSEQTLS